MIEKACFKCDQVKPLGEFYRHRGMKDGTLNKCKECSRRGSRENREKRLGYYRRYDAERNATPERRTRAKAYRHRDPVKQRAWEAMSRAIQRGKIKRQPCEVCGVAPAHGHHDDYRKPLAVRWLCAKHHAEHHAKEHEGGTG